MEELDWSAARQGRAIGAGTLDPVALTDGYLDRMDRYAETDRIYARATPDRARAEAAAAAGRARAGRRRGPLDGVPISWKDLFDSAGTATEAGSRLLAGRVPGADAEVLRAATAAGLVCLGKTHMSELAFAGLGVNTVTATPPNRHAPDAAPGGSSSGAAASVAFGLAAAAVGSDTGGSVRVPAAWNDLVGLKTTYGRLSLAGVVPLAPSYDTVGPLARTVEDCALLLAAMEGRRPADLAGADLTGARLMVLQPYTEDTRAAPMAGFRRACAALTAAGATIADVTVPGLTDAVDGAAAPFTAECYATWREVIEADPDRMMPQILDRFRMGASFGSVDVAAGQAALARARTAYTEATAGADAVILPTAPILPPEVERLLDDPDHYRAENLMTLRNARIANLLGLCALTLPTGVPAAGLTLMTASRQEGRLLRLGAATERALG